MFLKNCGRKIVRSEQINPIENATELVRYRCKLYRIFGFPKIKSK